MKLPKQAYKEMVQKLRRAKTHSEFYEIEWQFGTKKYIKYSEKFKDINTTLNNEQKEASLLLLKHSLPTDNEIENAKEELIGKRRTVLIISPDHQCEFLQLGNSWQYNGNLGID